MTKTEISDLAFAMRRMAEHEHEDTARVLGGLIKATKSNETRKTLTDLAGELGYCNHPAFITAKA